MRAGGLPLRAVCFCLFGCRTLLVLGEAEGRFLKAAGFDLAVEILCGLWLLALSALAKGSRDIFSSLRVAEPSVACGSRL
jgi:hypothetical protein